MTTQTKTKKTKADFVNFPLTVLYSARLRLTDEQRETLRNAHRAFRSKYNKEPQTNVLAGSTLSVATSYSPPNQAYADFGLSDLIVSDILGSRDSISLHTILKLQSLLSCKVIDRTELETKFGEYLDYLQV